MLTLLLFVACTSKTPDTSGDTSGDTSVDTDSSGDTDTGDTDTGDTDTGDTDTDTDTGDTDTGDTDTGEDTGPSTACLPPGTYGDPDWDLTVAADCSAYLKGFCGEGGIRALQADTADGSFSTKLTWTWQGGGPSAGKDPAIFAGTVVTGVVNGTLTWRAQVDPVHAVLGATPGTGLGVSNCPLD